MVIAYVLVKANTSAVDSIRDEILALDGVENAHVVAGDVDVIARVNVDTPADVKEVVATGVLTIRGVESTRTYVAMV